MCMMIWVEVGKYGNAGWDCNETGQRYVDNLIVIFIIYLVVGGIWVLLQVGNSFK